LLGVASVHFVIPAFIAAPQLLIAGVAAWVALCLYLSLLDSSPRSYVFLLAGYTLPLLGMPLANNPAALFDLTQWRAQEIGLGALLSMTAHTVFAPRSVKPVLVAKVRTTLGEFRQWMLRGLGSNAVEGAERRSRERVGSDLSEMGALAVHLGFESGVSTKDIAVVRALQQRMLAVLPLLAGVEERLAAIRAANALLGTQIDAHMEQVRIDLEGKLTRRDVARLVESGKALVDEGQAGLGADKLLAFGAMHRLAELLDAWRECLALSSRLEGNPDPDDSTGHLVAAASQLTPHVDHGLAAYSGFAAALAVVVAGTLCWALGWDQGAPAVGLAAVCSSLFAFLDDPRPIMKVMVGAIVLCVPVAALYVFAIFPALDGPLSLALALAPLLFASALGMTMPPKVSLPAFSFVLMVFTLMSIQPVQAGDFSTFTATAIALALGATIALVVTSLVRVISAETRVRRLLRAVWNDLAAMADETGEHSRAQWASRMIDRMSQLLPRVGGTSGLLRARAEHALDDLRMGVNLLDLRQAGLAANPRVRKAIEASLRQMGAHFRRRLESPDVAPVPTILQSIDRVIAALLESDSGPMRTQGLTAATGLRLGLFPPNSIAAPVSRAST
jgi:uncharacterized membrane protein YccC